MKDRRNAMADTQRNEDMGKSHPRLALAKQKHIWIWFPLLILPSLVFLQLGITRWAILSLGLIPLSIIAWDLYIMYLSEEARKVREIWKNLTESELQQLKKLSVSYGGKGVALFGAGAGGSYGILRTVFGIDDTAYIVLAELFVFAILVPFERRWRKPIIHFAFSTEYAKGKGWEQRQGLPVSQR
jgi:hypothetical protein